MPVAQRVPIRRGNPSLKTSTGNLRPLKKTSTAAVVTRQEETNVKEQSDEVSSVLKKLVDRFRFDEPKAPEKRQSFNSDIWWLRDEEKETRGKTRDNERYRRPDIPEYIETNSSKMKIDRDLHRLRSAVLNETSSDRSSDIGQVSSTGVGSTISTLTGTTTTTTTSISPLPIYEKPARPIFTRDHDPNNREDDVLYQWRLRRRLEQAQNGEPITFPSKLIHRSPPPPPPPPRPIEKPLTISKTNDRSLLKDATTQTVQDVSVQTSPSLLSNTVDSRPIQSEYNDVQISSSLPSHSKQTLRLISSVHQPRSDTFLRPSKMPQSLRDSTLTDITSMTDRDRHPTISHYRQISNDCEQFHTRSFSHSDENSDELLNMFTEKRDQLLETYRDIEQRLRHMDWE